MGDREPDPGRESVEPDHGTPLLGHLSAPQICVTGGWRSTREDVDGGTTQDQHLHWRNEPLPEDKIDIHTILTSHKHSYIRTHTCTLFISVPLYLPLLFLLQVHLHISLLLLKFLLHTFSSAYFTDLGDNELIWTEEGRLGNEHTTEPHCVFCCCGYC